MGVSLAINHHQISAMGGPQDTNGSYEWVRCPGCRHGLWRAYSDRLEAALHVRGRSKRTIRAWITAGSWLSVVCDRCGTTLEIGEPPARPEAAP